MRDTTQDPKIESILARVKKMLTLAGNAGATSGEAENALRMAHELIAKYNLELASLEGGSTPDVAKVVREAAEFQRSQWVRILANGVARANFCGAAYTGNQVYFYGRPENIAVVVELTRWLVWQLRMEHVKSMHAYRRTVGKEPTGWTNSFYIAAVGTVIGRLRAMQRTEGTSTALVRTDRMTEVDAAMRGKVRTLAAYKARMFTSAREAGAAAGQRVSLTLTDQLAKGSRARALGR